jgi:hypothetical protein
MLQIVPAGGRASMIQYACLLLFKISLPGMNQGFEDQKTENEKDDSEQIALFLRSKPASLCS